MAAAVQVRILARKGDLVEAPARIALEYQRGRFLQATRDLTSYYIIAALCQQPTNHSYLSIERVNTSTALQLVLACTRKVYTPIMLGLEKQPSAPLAPRLERQPSDSEVNLHQKTTLGLRENNPRTENNPRPTDSEDNPSD